MCTFIIPLIILSWLKRVLEYFTLTLKHTKVMVALHFNSQTYRGNSCLCRLYLPLIQLRFLKYQKCIFWICDFAEINKLVLRFLRILGDMENEEQQKIEAQVFTGFILEMHSLINFYLSDTQSAHLSFDSCSVEEKFFKQDVCYQSLTNL